MRSVFKVLVIGFAITLVALLFYLRHDTPARNYADLAVERREVPTDQNALTFLKAAKEHLFWPTNSEFHLERRAFVDGKSTNTAWVAETVSNNTETLRLLGQAAACPYLEPDFVGPTTPDNMPDQFLSIDLNLMRLLELATRHERLQGNHNAATESCAALIVNGARIHHGALLLVDSLIGLAFLNTGCQQAIDLARDPYTPINGLERLAATIDAIPPLDAGTIRAIKGDFQLASGLISYFATNAPSQTESTALHSGNLLKSALWARAQALKKVVRDGAKPRLPFRVVFHPNRTRESFADLSRLLIANASHCWAEIDSRLRDSTWQADWEIATESRWLRFRNPVGNILLSTMAVSPDFLRMQAKTACLLAGTRLTLACTVYKKKERNWPETLHVLCPDYLTAVPIDPFDGQPFRYVRKRGIVYSVGEDLQDDGGSTALRSKARVYNNGTVTSRWAMADAVFELPPYVR